MTGTTDATDYLQEAARILYKALTYWEQLAITRPYDMRAEILDARLRIAEGFAKLAAVPRAAAPPDDEDEDEDDYWKDYNYTCSACGAHIGIFTGREGWHHYRGEGTAASPVELYDAGHEAVPAQVTETSDG